MFIWSPRHMHYFFVCLLFVIRPLQFAGEHGAILVLFGSGYIRNVCENIGIPRYA